MLGSNTLFNDPVPLLLLHGLCPLFEVCWRAMVYAHIHQLDGDSHFEEMENSWVIGISLCSVGEELEVCNELINIPFFHL